MCARRAVGLIAWRIATERFAGGCMGVKAPLQVPAAMNNFLSSLHVMTGDIAKQNQPSGRGKTSPLLMVVGRRSRFAIVA